MFNSKQDIKSRKGRPNISDYLAGAILTNGLIWAWLQILAYFYSSFSEYTLILFTYASLIIYFLAATLSSYLVCSTTKSQHLIAGLKLSVLAWIFSIFFMIAYFENQSIFTAIIFLFCFFAGGIVGSYLASRYGLRIARFKEENIDNT